MSATWATFLFEAANFLVLAAVLGRFFFRPLRAAVEQRRSQMQEEQRSARQAHEEALRLQDIARKERSDLQSSLDTLRAEMRRDVERERQELLASARAQIDRERAAQRDEGLAARRARLRSSAQDTARVAREVVVGLLAEIGGPDLEGALLRRATREIASLRELGPLPPVVVESATDLDADAVSMLAEAAGIPAGELKHHRTADLVAGVRVLTSRGLLDLSASGMATAIARDLADRLEQADRSDG